MGDIYFSGRTNTEEIPPLNQPGPPPLPPKKNKKRFLPLKIAVAFLLIVVVVFSAGFLYVYSLMRTTDYNEEGHKDNVYVDSNILKQDENVINILFIGVDARVEDTASRSDSMILFSIDKNNNKIKLTSFMRDTWVDIPDKGFAKLNAACTYGGAQLVMDTLEYNLNIKINNYILVDFDAFMTIIDKLGGIEVEITDKEAETMRDDYFFKTQPGSDVHLDGNEALWYCRIRYLDSDFMRTFRQRKVVTSIIDKAEKTGIIELTGILKDVLPIVETDINPLDLTKLAMGATMLYRGYDIEQARIPADDTWHNATKKGQAVLEADIGANQIYLEDFLYKPDSEKETATADN
jgi:polyisoprenyl-teichoic acid--peptidoglycan teichoic acid transferase